MDSIVGIVTIHVWINLASIKYFKSALLNGIQENLKLNPLGATIQ